MSEQKLREAADSFRDAQDAITPLQVGDFNSGDLSRLRTLQVQLGDWADQFVEIAEEKEEEP